MTNFHLETRPPHYGLLRRGRRRVPRDFDVGEHRQEQVEPRLENVKFTFKLVWQKD